MMSRTTRKKQSRSLDQAVNDMVSEGGNTLLIDNTIPADDGASVEIETDTHGAERIERNNQRQRVRMGDCPLIDEV
jgi:hypothetical protein